MTLTSQLSDWQSQSIPCYILSRQSVQWHHCGGVHPEPARRGRVVSHEANRLWWRAPWREGRRQRRDPDYPRNLFLIRESRRRSRIQVRDHTTFRRHLSFTKVIYMQYTFSDTPPLSDDAIARDQLDGEGNTITYFSNGKPRTIFL